MVHTDIHTQNNLAPRISTTIKVSVGTALNEDLIESLQSSIFFIHSL